ncbi:MAG TPA: acyl carrier protein [Verrucomicrobiae bacterium]|nr:acyl carrier protein [Verrucomicrobiae bacterium]
MNELIEVLKTIRPEADFANSKDFIEDGLLDSFDVVTLVAALDKKYGISIPGDAIVPENFKDIQSIGGLLKKCGVNP